MTNYNFLKILKKIPFLNVLGDVELERLLLDCRTVTIAPEQVFFEEGETGDCMFVILSGQLEIYKENKKIADRGPGEFFGEMALVDSEPRSASVRAITDSELLEINKNEFGWIFNSHPQVALEILKTTLFRHRNDLTTIDWSFKELKTTEQLYRGIVETVSDIILQVSPDHKIVFANSAVRQLNYEPEELLGRPLKDIINEEDHGTVIPKLTTKRSGERTTANLEITVTSNRASNKPPQDLTLLLNAFGLWDIPDEKLKRSKSEKKFIGTLITGRDITERKRAEIKLKEAHDALEQRVLERTAQLAESNQSLKDEIRKHLRTLDDLNKAKIEAETANRAKTDFLSRMSHELRTPMNSVIGYSQLLMDSEGEWTSDQHSEVQRIYDSGNHLMLLINDILDLTHIEAGRLELALEDVQINGSLEEAISVIMPLASNKQIKITSNLKDRDPILVQCDPTRIMQVWLNLLSNAVKYNYPKGNIEIQVDVVNAKTAAIHIKDTGPGISQEEKNKIFEPFNRLHTPGLQEEGTGIGLTITKNLIELMNGSISVESKMNVGSCFTVTLQLADKTASAVATDSPPPQKADVHRDSEKPEHVKKILCIEDNLAHLQLIKRIITTHTHYEIISASIAKLGIELAQAHQPDLILMDMQLPDIDGIAAFLELQKLEETASIPVIAISANALKTAETEAMDIGFKEYIVKPYQIRHLIETIDNYLAMKTPK
ncbi:MAG: cyclic nucleotide-binding domain-containing protein [Candidatus Nitrohelix vancouverensis]|uniref:histidine kinase n=1 Tax=Candidatus Nitrohelix vancouverensis TaxID=2705534 RepID=A0A7T0C073_9BACT|nr:MAG: cyclic nucleotide-binding domain-containing protein [Candidatus Nitrohelix vancouverensis]